MFRVTRVRGAADARRITEITVDRPSDEVWDYYARPYLYGAQTGIVAVSAHCGLRPVQGPAPLHVEAQPGRGFIRSMERKEPEEWWPNHGHQITKYRRRDC